MAEISTVLLRAACYLLMRPCQKIKGAHHCINRTKRGAEPPFYALLPDSNFMLAGLFAYIGSSSFVLQKDLALVQCNLAWCLALTASDLHCFMDLLAPGATD